MGKGILQNIFSRYIWNFRCFSVILQVRMEARERAGGWLKPVTVLV